MARRRIPQVIDAYLTHRDGAENALPPIAVDSAEWHAWLDAPTTCSFAFHSAAGTFTARCERQHGHQYWYGYRTLHGRLHKTYIGKPDEMTQARLLDVATLLNRVQPPPPTPSPAATGRSPSRGATPAEHSLASDLSSEHHPTAILTTKLYMPRTRPHLVSRARLVERLQPGLNGKLTLISAPAGFGKTTLLTDWLQQVAHSVAWVSLDERDADPWTFLAYLVAALQTVAPAVGATTWAGLHALQPPSVESLVSALLNDVMALPQPIILVLDDFHTVHTPAIQHTVAFLLEHQPPQLHLVIATRADPALPLARLRARNDLTELGAADLRFTTEEAAAFLTDVMNLPLSVADVAALEARTEGWIAGLQFAALAMRDRTDLASFVTAFTGTHRFVLDYLVEEVLTRQPPHLQTFLLQTAILDRLCAPLCDAVLATDDENAPGQATDAQPAASSQTLLEALDHANLFVIALDDDRQWYRYHYLFSEVLRARLTSSSTQAAVARLHQRAATWYAQQDLYPEAIHHALTAEDWTYAARVIEARSLPVIFQGQVHTVLGWLAMLPDAFVRARPRLCLIYALALGDTHQLDAAEAYLQDAERGVGDDIPSDQTSSILGHVALTRAMFARSIGDLARCVALSHQALAVLPEGEAAERAAARLNTARAYLVHGDVTSTNARLAAEVVAPARASGNRFAYLSAFTNLARFEVLQGRLHAAAATYRRAAQVDPTLDGLLVLGSASASYCFGFGDLLREWNDLHLAEQHLAQGMKLVRGSLTVDADVVTLGYLALACVQQAQGDSTGATATLDEFTDLARERGFVAHLIARGVAAQAQIALTQGNLVAAIRWADSSGLHPDDDVIYVYEDAYLTFARVCIAQAQADASNEKAVLQSVLRLLDRLLHAAEAGGRSSSVIAILILRALAFQAQHDLHAALHTLTRVLMLAEPEGYVRVFVGEGAPMVTLLHAAYQRGMAPTYVAALLAASGTVDTGIKSVPLSAPGATTLTSSHPLVEPLSSRESEVLHLIAAGKSNAEIAHTLVIAVSTVKTHTNTIFGKLGVTSRTHAVARARDLHLL
jgi:LuxR family maltose regulon positive regulatory protein